MPAGNSVSHRPAAQRQRNRFEHHAQPGSASGVPAGQAGGTCSAKVMRLHVSLPQENRRTCR